MSLYNNVSKNLHAELSGVSGSSTASGSLLGVGAKALSGLAAGAIMRYIPSQTRYQIGQGTRVVGDVLNGDMLGAASRLAGSGLLDDILPGGVKSKIIREHYSVTPNALLGGITPAEARKIYDDMRSYTLAKKNLFCLEVTSNLVGSAASQCFNFFATEIEYSPFILSGEKRKVGSASIDCIQGSDPVELRITTFDDRSGSLRRWFADHSSAIASKDGTVGVPANYAVHIRIGHGYITQESRRDAYQDCGWFRPNNLDVSLSRSDDGLMEIQMSFSQIDTFYGI